MPRLKLGESGLLVARWNAFLASHEVPHDAGDMFGSRSESGTIAFQKAVNKKFGSTQLTVDGIAGNLTLGFAIASNLTDDLDAARVASLWGYNYPPRLAGLPPPPSQEEMHQQFGKIEFQHAPEPGNDERIVITNGWADRNLERFQVPQLKQVTGGSQSGSVWFHKAAGAQLVALWQCWELAGVLPDVKTYEGAFNARLKRGSKTELSNHAWGTAFDINYGANRLNAMPSTPDEIGCVYRLVPLANALGFNWGGSYRGRLDGMHFEVTRILSADEISAVLHRASTP